MMWEWHPRESLGNIRFGLPLSTDIISQYALKLAKYDDSPQDIVFESADRNLQVFIENDVVDHIESWHFFFTKVKTL